MVYDLQLDRVKQILNFNHGGPSKILAPGTNPPIKV